MDRNEIEQRLRTQIPDLKINARYFIIDEAPGYAFGFNPNAPDALVLWSVHHNDYLNGIYRHTLEGFGLRDLALCGLHVHQLNVILNECGYDSMHQLMATEPPINAKNDMEKDPEIIGFYHRINDRPPADGVMLGYPDGSKRLTTGLVYLVPSEELMENWEPVERIDLDNMKSILAENIHDPMFDVAENRQLLQILDSYQNTIQKNIQQKIDRMINETGTHPFVFKHDGKPIMVSFPPEAENYFSEKEMDDARAYILQSESRVADQEQLRPDHQEEKHVGLSAALKAADKAIDMVHHSKSLTQKLNELQR